MKLSELVAEVNLEQDSAFTECIADDVNDTIRLEYKLGGSFTEQEVETLIYQKITQEPSVEFDQVNALVDYNLIGA